MPAALVAAPRGGPLLPGASRQPAWPAVRLRRRLPPGLRAHHLALHLPCAGGAVLQHLLHPSHLPLRTCADRADAQVGVRYNW